MVKERRTELVEGFRHSVPYINAHRGKTFVIMLGGEAIEHENFSNIVNDIGLLHSLGIRLVVVYGARPQIDANLAEHHHEPVYHKQTRVTDAKTLELVKQAAGMLQLEITARLSGRIASSRAGTGRGRRERRVAGRCRPDQGCLAGRYDRDGCRGRGPGGGCGWCRWRGRRGGLAWPS